MPIRWHRQARPQFLYAGKRHTITAMLGCPKLNGHTDARQPLSIEHTEWVHHDRHLDARICRGQFRPFAPGNFLAELQS